MEGKPDRGGALVTVLALGLLVLNGVLLWQLHRLNNRVQALQDAVRGTTLSFEEKLSRALDGVQKELVAKGAEKIDLIRSSAQAQLSQTVADTHQRLLKDNDDFLKKMAQSFNENIDQTLAKYAYPNYKKSLAEAAYAKGAQEEKAGNRDNAKVYYLRALYHRPEDSKYTEAFANLVLNQKDASLEQLRQLQNILETAPYQASAESVPTLLALLQQTNATYEVLFQKLNPPKPPLRDEAAKWLAEVDDVFTPYFDKDKQAYATEPLTQFVMRLRSAYSELSEEPQDKQDKTLLARLKATADRAEVVITVQRLCDYVDGCFEKLDAMRQGNQLDNDMAVSVIQSSESTLPQFWGQNLKEIPPSLSAKVRGYPATLNKWVAEIGMARCQPSLKKLKELSEKAHTLADGVEGVANAPALDHALQEKATQIENLQKQALSEFESLNAKEASNKGKLDIQAINEALTKCRVAQNNRYQHWVIQRCKEAFAAYDAKTVITASRQRAWLDALAPWEIDQSLLSPDVNRLYSDVLAPFLRDLTGRGLPTAEIVEYQARIGNPEGKRKLEDF